MSNHEPVKVTPLRLLILIRRGAKIVEFQKFIAGPGQDFETTISFNNKLFLARHQKPFHFTIQKGEIIVPDNELPDRPNKDHPL